LKPNVTLIREFAVSLRSQSRLGVNMPKSLLSALALALCLPGYAGPAAEQVNAWIVRAGYVVEWQSASQPPVTVSVTDWPAHHQQRSGRLQ